MTISYPDDPPPEPGFTRAQLQIQSITTSSQNPSSLQRRTETLKQNRWAGNLVVNDMPQSKAKAWKAWVMRMTGKVGSFKLGDPGYPGPQGDVSKKGTIERTAEDNENVTWIVGKNYEPNTTIFKQGDQIEIDGDLKIVVEDVKTDTSGRCFFHVIPRIRDNQIEGQAIKHDNPKGEFRLDQSISQWDDETIMSMLEFPIVEVI